MNVLPLPLIERDGERATLLVDGHPFLILGLQWDCDSCMSHEEMTPLFAYAAQLHANTAALPVYWSEVEPAQGQYDFSMVDERLRLARENGLRLVLLWFATWKNASCFYCPDYIREDHVRYPRARSADGTGSPSPCPLSEATFERDRDALVALVSHLSEADTDRRVILFQIENEPGVLTTARCHCSRCDEEFAAGNWQKRWGEDADEAFSTASIASYIDHLTKAAKSVYDIPYYVNVAIPLAAGAVPGKYFSGGAVPWMLELFRANAPTLELIAPDIYMGGYRDFAQICSHYGRLSGPLYVAEHSSDPSGRAERNVFYAIGEHAAIGFDPWAIDAAFPDQGRGQAFVDVPTGTIRPHGSRLAESYLAIRRAISPISAAQGTPRLFTFVQESGEGRSGLCADGCDIVLQYQDPDGMSRGLVIQEDTDTFILIGLGFSAYFLEPRPSGTPRLVRSAEWGRYEHDRWVPLHRIRREHPEDEGYPIRMAEPGVARVLLEPKAVEEAS
jgi:Beta-galactosidase/Domain of unknown function (DUF5597)